MVNDRNFRTTAEAMSERDMTNKKPYRSKVLKVAAAKDATVRKDGAFRSDVKTLRHGKEKQPGQ